MNKRKQFQRARGYGLAEMTVALVVIGTLSVGAIYKIRNTLENQFIDRSVAQLTTIVADIYECYLSGDCKNPDPALNLWHPMDVDRVDLSSTSLTDAGEGVDLVVDLPFNAHLGTQLPSGVYFYQAVNSDHDVEISYQLPAASEKRTARRASRIASAFGTSASVVAGEGLVQLTLGVPGTEQAFSAAITQSRIDMRRDIQERDLVFSDEQDDKADVRNVGVLEADSLIIGGRVFTAADLARYIPPAPRPATPARPICAPGYRYRWTGTGSTGCYCFSGCGRGNNGG